MQYWRSIQFAPCQGYSLLRAKHVQAKTVTFFPVKNLVDRQIMMLFRLAV